MPLTSFQEILDIVKAEPTRKLAVAGSADECVLEAVKMAWEGHIAEPILVGDADETVEIAKTMGFTIPEEWLVDEPNDIRAARTAVKLVHDGRADVLMKGMMHTDDFLRAVLDKEVGLRTGALMSHCFLIEVPNQNRLIYATDPAMNIAPTLIEKAGIVLNAVYLARLFGIEKPKVAAVCAVEVVNPNMPATIDAAVLAKMSERKQFQNCIIEGPLALDNAISELAAKQKKIEGEVAGRADIVLLPDIEAGNVLVKTVSNLCGGRGVGILIGAAAPVVVTSRADTPDAKMISIATAILMAQMARKKRYKIGKIRY